MIQLRCSGSSFIVPCSCNTFSRLKYHLVGGTSCSCGDREWMLVPSFFFPLFCIVSSALPVAITHLYSDTCQASSQAPDPHFWCFFLSLLCLINAPSPGLPASCVSYQNHCISPEPGLSLFPPVLPSPLTMWIFLRVRSTVWVNFESSSLVPFLHLLS